jgi:hypothetical protein
MKRYVEADTSTTDVESIAKITAEVKSQIKRHSEHFINDDGEDSFAIYEDDAIQIFTDALNKLKR